MAVASFGGCHQVKAFAQANVAASHRQHGDAITHPNVEQRHGKHGTASLPGDDAGNGSTQDGSRVKCASCAACHLCSVVLNTETVLADIPTDGSVSFPESDVPRVRNVASGLERPPRA